MDLCHRVHQRNRVERCAAPFSYLRLISAVAGTRDCPYDPEPFYNCVVELDACLEEQRRSLGCLVQVYLRNRECAAVKLPDSGLLVTTAATLSSLVVCWIVFLRCKLGGGGRLTPFRPAAFLIETFDRFLLAPPRSGLTKIVAPNERKLCEAATSDGLQIIERGN